MRAKILMAGLLSLFICGQASAQSSDAAGEQPASESAGKSLGHRLVYWIPNRIFDLLDIARLRARVGPGLTVGARVTEAVDVMVGAHETIYVGLHGPRSRPQIPWPVGFERYAGAEVSVASVGSDEGALAPQYGPAEIGLGTQILIVGFDIGIEPLDVLDFALGLLTLDPKGDDF